MQTRADSIRALATHYYDRLTPIYEEMIEVEVDDDDDWLRAETKLDECLDSLHKLMATGKRRF